MQLLGKWACINKMTTEFRLNIMFQYLLLIYKYLEIGAYINIVIKNRDNNGKFPLHVGLIVTSSDILSFCSVCLYLEQTTFCVAAKLTVLFSGI